MKILFQQFRMPLKWKQTPTESLQAEDKCGVWQRFHCDQRGTEALQVVMILAVGAVVLGIVKHWWPWWTEFFNLAIDILVEN